MLMIKQKDFLLQLPLQGNRNYFLFKLNHNNFYINKKIKQTIKLFHRFPNIHKKLFQKNL